MAPKGNVKGFFKEKKKTGGIAKPYSSSKAKSSKKSSPPKHAASFVSDIAQPPALISHAGSLDLQDDCDGNEEVLRQFDMNLAYGPCIGMTRMARWERASKLGMNPPGDVERLLRAGKVRGISLFDGRI